jgi:hypothetical protein
MVSFLLYVYCVFSLVRRLCLSSCTYIVSFLLYVDCVFSLVRRLCLSSCTKRHNLRTRGKTQYTYKRKDIIYVQEKRYNLRTRKDTIYVQEKRHNLRTREKTQSTQSFLLYVDCVFPLVRRLCLSSCT